MPTLDDVARRAGVARVTVSRVLNGSYPEKVSAETRERILRVVAEMNFRQNVLARGLRSKRTMEYGLVIPNLARSFMPEVVQGLQDAASEIDYVCLLHLSHDDPSQEEAAFRTLASRRVDGIIWMPLDNSSPHIKDIVGEIPIVKMLNHSSVLQAPAVEIDQEASGYLAARHLLELGHRHIAYIAVDHRIWRTRLAGFGQALAEWGVEFNPEFVERVRIHDYRLGYEAALRLLKRLHPPTAIVAASDMSAWGVLRAAQELGRKVPTDLSVVGYGDIPIAGLLDIPLTTFGHPKLEVGAKAMRLLAERMSGNKVESVLYQPELIMRSSSAKLTG